MTGYVRAPAGRLRRVFLAFLLLVSLAGTLGANSVPRARAASPPNGLYMAAVDDCHRLASLPTTGDPPTPITIFPTQPQAVCIVLSFVRNDVPSTNFAETIYDSSGKVVLTTSPVGNVLPSSGIMITPTTVYVCSTALKYPLGAPGTPWPVDTYRTDLLVNGAVAQSVTWTIGTPAAPAATNTPTAVPATNTPSPVPPTNPPLPATSTPIPPSPTGTATLPPATSTATTTRTATATPSGVSARQGTYYLALGDSLSEGYQPGSTISYTHGWVYQFRDMLARQAPIELINLALGGECTGTFIKGDLSPGCPTKTISSPSQLEMAAAYLRAYEGRVNPITVEIGGDNLYGSMQAFLKANVAQQQQLVAKIFAPMGREWATIFGTLRKACPTCTIVAVNQYNPFPTGDARSASVAKVMAAYDALLKQAAAPFGVKVADVNATFVGHEPAYTWIARNDIHATTAGYTAMAKVVARASGLVR